MTKTTLLGAAMLSLTFALPVAAETAGHGEPAADHGAAPVADHGAAATDHGAADDHAAPGGDHGVTADTGHGAAGLGNLGQVVATVNGKEITVGHMMVAKAGLPEQYQMIPDDQLWDGLLEQLIQQEVLAQSGDAHETALVRLSMDNEQRSLMAAVAITSVARRAVNEAKVLEIYQRDFVDVDKGKEYNASHILLDTEAEAQAVLEDVKNGADFAATAREKSTGPSGPNGGSLGWFGDGMMVEPFQKAVEGMNPGDVVGPVQTQFGWHVIKLNNTRSAEAPLLADVRNDIEQTVQQEAVEKHIDALMAQNQITRTPQTEVDPSILSRTDLLEE